MTDGLEILPCAGEGYHRVVDSPKWTVAALNYAERFDEKNLIYLERHNLTDEAFVLLDGAATLLIGEKAERVPLKPLTCYNVKRGTWLEGTGYYIPRDDRAFGAVPDAPTNNIFIANSSAILHFDDEAEIHANRNVLIASNVAMRVGNSKNASLKGTISTAGADPAASVLRVLNNWDGVLTLAPPSDRQRRCSG